MEATIYNQTGKKAGTVKLPESFFGLKWNANLVHQVVTSMLSSRRKGTAHTKDRGEVAGGGKKPWKQKGTGRARHGSTRSPIWRHGGVAHGPRNDKNYDRKVNASMKRKALYTVLSAKLRDEEIVFVDDLKLKEMKTKLAKEVMETLFDKVSKKKNNAILLALPKKDTNVERGFRNFSNVSIVESRNLNPADILSYKYLAIVDPEGYIKTLK